VSTGPVPGTSSCETVVEGVEGVEGPPVPGAGVSSLAPSDFKHAERLPREVVLNMDLS
jgi:hypothetical protein